MTANTALIAGATGQIGRAVSDYFSSQDGWNLIGLSRKPESNGVHPMIQADLTDPVDCRRKLAGLTGVTHIIYAARYDHIGGQAESATTNSAMLSNILDAVEPMAPNLRHIHLVHGTKYYGHNRAPMAEPFREDMPRGNFENFYFSQQDFLDQRQQGQAWNWSISRPHTFCNLMDDEPRSITLVVAVYAAILRELGLPLTYPGTYQSFTAKTQFTWLPLLAKAIFWMSTDPRCANQAYNVVNDDPRSWDRLWPRIASYFGMSMGEPKPVVLADFMVDKQPVWEKIVAKHGLRRTDLHSLAQWVYGDYVFSTQWDVISNMMKARSHGFIDKIDTERMWIDSFDFLRKQKIIP